MERTGSHTEPKDLRVFRSLLAILFVRVVTGNEVLFSVLSVFLLSWLAIGGARIAVPRVAGLRAFLWVTILYGVLGMVANGSRSALRDLFYILPSIVWIIIGYVLALSSSRGSAHSMIKTLYVYGALVSGSCLVRFASMGSADSGGFRSIFSWGVYDVGFIVPILAFEVFVRGRYCFSKRTDVALLALMCSQILLSLGRISFSQPVIFLLVMALLMLAVEGTGAASLKIVVVCGLLVLVAVGSIELLPRDLVAVFVEKIPRSFMEVNIDKGVQSTEDAMLNWRAYEVQAAVEQWREAPWNAQLFGTFLGAGVPLEYVPYSWSDVVQNGQIPLLHNGFVSLLPKFGLVGIALFGSLFVGVFVKGLRIARRGGRGRFAGYYLSSLSVSSAVVTCVVRGPVSGSVFFVWGVLIGWFLGRSDDKVGAAQLSPSNGRSSVHTDQDRL